MSAHNLLTNNAALRARPNARARANPTSASPGSLLGARLSRGFVAFVQPLLALAFLALLLTPSTALADGIDDDGDGFCEEPTCTDGSSPGDCDDTDADEFPGQTWYVDDDSDGYGSISLSLTECERPAGYVPNFADCDDGDPDAASPNQTWYPDNDSDTYGANGATVVQQCVNPGSHAPNNLDCDDSTFDASATAQFRFPDNDNDGFGLPSSAGSYVCDFNFKSLNNDDCDDSPGGANTYPGAAENETNPSLCMKDTDGDGYGDNTTTGAISQGTDCDDTHQFTFPGAAEYEVDYELYCHKDDDWDGYGDLNPPADVDAGTDCYDDPAGGAELAYPGAAENEDDNTLCMFDADGDGYGDVANYGFPVDTGTDCDDAEANTFPGAAETDSTTSCMKDTDEDGYGDSSNFGGELFEPGTDCDDGDGLPINELTKWFPDGDGDTYGLNGSQPTQGCTGPIGDVPNDHDCNDSSVDPYLTAQFRYPDADNDTYGASGSAGAYLCDLTFTSDNNDDCDDLSPGGEYTFPGAAETDSTTSCMKDEDEDGYGDSSTGGGELFEPGTDCDDGDGLPINELTKWFPDGDGDTYGLNGSSFTAQGCTGIGNDVPNDYDCNDSTSDSGPTAQFRYPDADDDDHGASGSAGAYLCVLTFTSDNNDDCDDVDSDTFPGAAPYDSLTLCMKDTDGDDFGDENPTNGAVVGSDCDDTDIDQYPNQSWYPDTDEDGYGDSAGSFTLACLQPPGRVSNADDCDDDPTTDGAYTYPGAAANDDTNACMKDADEDNYGDATEDPAIGYMTGSDCDDANPAINPDAPENCGTGEDEDCDGDIDTNDSDCPVEDSDGDGYCDNASATCTPPLLPGDCDDGDLDINPGADELCGMDYNCNSINGDHATDAIPYGYDCDGDGVPTESTSFTAIATGADATCVISGAGYVECFGSPFSAVANFPTCTEASAIDVTATATLPSHGCMISADDQLPICWGDDTNSSGQASGQVSGAPSTALTEIGVAEAVSCGITVADGSLTCWGDTTSLLITELPTATGLTGLSMGYYHACALDSSGTPVCWGDEAAGEVNEPDDLITDYSQIEVGYQLTCAIATASGSIECWGNDAYGQVTSIPSGNFSDLVLGENFGCAIDTSATSTVCWGANTVGALPPYPGTPNLLAAGGLHACSVLDGNGALACWGDNSSGQAPNTYYGPSLCDTTSPPAHLAEPFDWSGDVIIDSADADCDDGDPRLAPYREWFSDDSDEDGYGIGTAETQCLEPAKHTTNDLDCNNSDADSETATLYRNDSDEDGFAQPNWIAGDWSESGQRCGITEQNTAVCTSYIADSGLDLSAVQDVRISLAGACFLYTDGSIACFGDVTGELTQIGAIDADSPPYNQVAIFASDSIPFDTQAMANDYGAWGDACALADTGLVECWGLDDPTPGSTFQHIAVGEHFACGVTDFQEVECWGDASSPSLLAGPSGTGSYTFVSAGLDFACALDIDGKATCWGNDSNHQAAPPPLATFIELSAGRTHACGLTNDGQVLCWGDNANGQSPIFTSLDNVNISLDGDLTCIVDRYGDWSCTGNTAEMFAELGYPSAPDTVHQYGYAGAPSEYSCGGASDPMLSDLPGDCDDGNGDISPIEDDGCNDIDDDCDGVIDDNPPAGDSSSVEFFVDADGDGYGVGNDYFGNVYAGPDYSCVTTGLWNNAIQCWGNPNNPLKDYPQDSVHRISSIAIGEAHACVLYAHGAVTCFGDSTNNKTTPPPNTSFYSIAAGYNHTCGVTLDFQRIECWGADDFNQSSVPAGIDPTGSIAAGAHHTCALSSGADPIVCWGDNTHGQTTWNIPTVSNLNEYWWLAAGRNHTCVASDTGIACWGQSEGDKLTPPDLGSAPILPHTLTAFGDHTCVLPGDPFAVDWPQTTDPPLCWGKDSSGQITNIPNQDDFEFIAAGRAHVCALRWNQSQNRSVAKCWGSNLSNQAPATYTGGTYLCVADPQNPTAPTGYSLARGDCNDTNAAIQPYIPDDNCDGVDDNCDGRLDNAENIFFADEDGDGYGMGVNAFGIPDDSLNWLYGTEIEACAAPDGYVDNPLDCDDHDATTTTERLYQDFDGDGYGQGGGPYSKLSMGPASLCARNELGALECWGIPYYYDEVGAALDAGAGRWAEFVGAQPIPPGGTGQITATVQYVSTGVDATCVINADSTVACWTGLEENGDPMTSPVVTNFPTSTTSPFVDPKAIEVGYQHACVINGDDSLTCWGEDTHFESGITTFNGESAVQVAPGADHTCILNTTGGISCLGEDNLSQTSGAPITNTWHLVCSQESYSCAAKSDKVKCWGGHPLDGVFETIADARDLSCGDEFVCALNGNGLATCWGPSENRVVFEALNSPIVDTEFASLDSSDNSTCGITVDGEVVCWGDNRDNDFGAGEFGVLYCDAATGVETNGDCDENEISINPNQNEACNYIDDNCDGFPDEGFELTEVYKDLDGDGSVSAPSGFIDVSSSGLSTCVITESGAIECWDGDSSEPLAPGTLRALAPTTTNFTQISTGLIHACALASDGDLECWGDTDPSSCNSNDIELCTGQTELPTEATYPDIIDLSANINHTCVLRDPSSVTDTNLVCFGLNEIIADTPTAGIYDHINTSMGYSCALKTGDIECWGIEAPVISDGSGDFIDTALGEDFVCALPLPASPTEPAVCWGNAPENASGQTISSATYTDIASSLYMLCGLKTDGEVDCYDNGQEGLVFQPTPAGPFERLEAGILSVCGLRADGSFRCWGNYIENTERPDYYPGPDPENPTTKLACFGNDFSTEGYLEATLGGDCNNSNQMINVAITWFYDGDGDGYGNANDSLDACDKPDDYVLASNDWNDSNPAIYPNAPEVCDGYDNDQDGLIDDHDPDSITGQTTWYADSDDDGFGDDSTTLDACVQPSNHVADSTDCDDDDANNFPGNTEICDGQENNCDNLIDDLDSTVTGQATWYLDSDMDSFGDAATTVDECSQPTGYVADSTDCDDDDANNFPGNTEICDGQENNCDNLIDDLDSTVTGQATWYLDSDMDSFGDAAKTVDECAQPTGYVADNTDCDDDALDYHELQLAYPDNDDDGFGDHLADGGMLCSLVTKTAFNNDDCDDTNPSINPETEWYTDSDGDTYGDETAPPTIQCEQPVGHVMNDSDCDDSSAGVNQLADEICDTIDNDCDNLIDDLDPTVTGQTTWYLDSDDDGYGDITEIVEACEAPDKYVADDTDCDDAEPDINPGEAEVCGNATDENCDGWAPECDGDDTDGDGFCDATTCLDGSMPGDCNDNNAQIHPWAYETCDGVDNNCNGEVDENLTIDNDGDGYSLIGSCEGSQNDCNDFDPEIYKDAPEICNGLDDNCDGEIDEGLSVDEDGDGFWAPDSCALNGFLAADCNDDPTQGGASINPDAVEDLSTTGVDDNCNGEIDEDPLLWDDDGDCQCEGNTKGDDCQGSIRTPPPPDPADTGQAPLPAPGECLEVTTGDCNDQDPSIWDRGDGEEPYDIENGIDDDCDGIIDNLEDNVNALDNDFDEDTFKLVTDCDPNDPTINPDAVELCDGIDNNCDGYLLFSELDRDQDGYLGCAEVGTNKEADCDDTNGMINPGVLEDCTDGIDNDCDGIIDTDADVDLDGVTTCTGDCDDNNPLVYSGKTLDGDYAREECNGIDDDCDGLIDENFDVDGDGFYDPYLCENIYPVLDCDDNNALVYPTAMEYCLDGIDNNCNCTDDTNNDGVFCGPGDDGVDENADIDDDGWDICSGDCNDENESVNPSEPERCNRVDDNCNGLVDENYDQDGDGYTTCAGDCDDDNETVNSLANEICDGLDNDCSQGAATYTATGDRSSIDNGGIPESADGLRADEDADGDSFVSSTCCDKYDTELICGNDCLDSDPEANPNAIESADLGNCNDGIDNNCNDMTDWDEPECTWEVGDDADFTLAPRSCGGCSFSMTRAPISSTLLIPLFLLLGVRRRDSAEAARQTISN